MPTPLPPHGIAATLVVLEYTDGEWKVLLNLRSKHLRRHPGEVCFPGGMREVEDQNLIETALREAYEEIGLPGENVRVCSVLKPFMSKHGIPMHPVISLLTKPFIPFCSEEVEKVFYSPLKAFLQKNNHTSFYIHDHFQLHSFMLEEMVWGLTAWVCIMVSMSISNQYPEYSIDYIKSRNRPAIEIVVELVANATRLSEWKKTIESSQPEPIDVSKGESKI
uniref:Nudix hydrolase domain-containing protein n=1 Tax=Acrobeloides nanus TaxID=290746 RepID=A0A914DRF1_9BILA